MKDNFLFALCHKELLVVEIITSHTKSESICNGMNNYNIEKAKCTRGGAITLYRQHLVAKNVNKTVEEWKRAIQTKLSTNFITKYIFLSITFFPEYLII